MSAAQRIEKIITHLEPHLDEFVAIYLARNFGQHVWLNIKKAIIETKNGSVKLIRRIVWLIIGIGEGPFDEHGPGKNNELCSADLIAQHLGIERHPKVSLLLKKIRTGDRTGKYTLLDLGQCVRMLNHIGWKPARIEKWLKVFLDCYFDEQTFVKNIQHETPADSIEFPVSNPKFRDLISRGIFFQQWRTETKKGKNEITFDQLTDQLKKKLATLSKQSPSKLFDLLECCTLIAAHHPDDQQIAYEWVVEIFTAYADYQHDFLSACDIIKQIKTKVIKPHPDCKPWEIIQVLGIDRRTNETGNRCLAAAAKFLYQNLDVLVIQQPSGNVQILILRNHRYSLLPMITRAIRLEEIIAGYLITDDTDLTYDHLASSGRISYADNWYLPINDQGQGWALLNGSLTMPKMPPTSIFFDRIMEILYKMVLTDNHKESWNEYVNGRIPEFN
ncbi:MAG: hypothetical protein Q8O72_03630 [Bacteroidales bacterium]|nr:hypothetical protein [Bacteroidales bacterium]